MISTISLIKNLDDFYKLLSNNPGLLIIKFGAEWCGPCKRIENNVLEWFEKMPNNVQTVKIDIDESFELYAHMKYRKMIKSIPGILMYKKGNNTYVFDDAVNTSNLEEIDKFFLRCLVASTL
jgi:thioredoxin 1